MEGDDRAPAESRVPALPEDFDLTSLKLDPFEGFIATRIDGRMGLQEIADSTGGTIEQVLGVIAKLELSGVLSWVEPPRVSRSPKPDSRRQRRPLRQTPGRGIVRTRPPPPGASRLLYDPAELEEADIDLDVERRREILDTFYRLDEVDHYQLLGIGRGADKKVIRDAYFKLSKLFHPDTLYGKRLGSYKTKMEVVFKRLTDAYDVLGKKKKRAKYDDYLKARDRLMGIEQQIEAGEEAATKLEEQVHHAAEGAVVMPSEPATPPPPPPESKPPRVSVRPDIDPAERRRRARALLEKRLRGATGSKPPSRRPSAKPSASPPTPDASKEDLLRGLASSLKQVAKITGGVARVERHVQDAKIAEEAGDLVGAVNALRLAVTLEPERADLRGQLEDLRVRLSTELADTYEKQARYEEEQENWLAAARSWAKVVEGRPGRGTPARRAAEALLKGEGDLRQARDFAQKAVDVQPKSAQNRLILGQVFVAAGMKASAQKELEEAAKLDPKDEMVKNLLRQLK